MSAVLFDFGGTLDAEGIPWRERFFRLFQEEGARIAPETFDRAFYDADDSLVGNVPADFSLHSTAAAVAEGVARNLGLADTGIGERVGRRFLADSLRRLADVSPLLARLGQRYRLGIVSNFYGNLETVCRDAGIHGHFSVLTDSAVVGAAKPNPAIFRHALAAVGAEPGEAVFIGDSLRRDVAGAAAVGMPCIWLRADLAETPVPGNGSCVVVQRLDAIGELLL